jgi:hypothetical protein
LEKPYIYPDALEVKGKPPKLKFDILEFLALKGNCSKTDLKNGLDRYYPDISHSVEELSRGEYIRMADKKLGRGKMQVYYAISEKGLKALLYYDKFDAIRFWEILHGYCQHSDKIVTPDKIEEFYQIVIRRHLKYYNHGFSSQLDIFDDLCNNWFQETIVKSNGVTPLQKVIEILASHPKIIFEKLVKEIDEPKERVKEVLSSHSYAYEPSKGGDVDESSSSFGTLYKGYTDFLIQNIIITEQSANDAEPTYELSLFGVMLCLAMIRYNDMDRLNGGLYRKYSFEKYFDMIALNYKKKLPLIFGKWNQLKGILKMSTHYNLDIILDREIRYNTKDSPSVRKGGNKQLIEGIREIILDNGELMSRFASEGSKVLTHSIIMQPPNPKAVNLPFPSSSDRVFWLRGKLYELQMLLDPYLRISSFVTFSMMGYMTRDTRTVLKHMEESFADEISAFYYMNLYNDSNSEQRKYYNSRSFKPLDKTPRQCLSLLLKQDKEKPLIREWLSKWRDDLTRLQSEVLDNVRVIV